MTDRTATSPPEEETPTGGPRPHGRAPVRLDLGDAAAGLLAAMLLANLFVAVGSPPAARPRSTSAASPSDRSASGAGCSARPRMARRTKGAAKPRHRLRAPHPDT